MKLRFRCNNSPGALKLKREVEAVMINYLIQAKVEPEIDISLSDTKIDYIFFRDLKLTDVQVNELRTLLKHLF